MEALNLWVRCRRRFFFHKKNPIFLEALGLWVRCRRRSFFFLRKMPPILLEAPNLWVRCRRRFFLRKNGSHIFTKCHKGGGGLWIDEWHQRMTPNRVNKILLDHQGKCAKKVSKFCHGKMILESFEFWTERVSIFRVLIFVVLGIPDTLIFRFHNLWDPALVSGGTGPGRRGNCPLNFH